ncbi:MAG: SHOCT domain-containing protein [Anaerolineae bacterium]|nr:SHOCT domain-containing protein [Anaerolineae bacterium]
MMWGWHMGYGGWGILLMALLWIGFIVAGIWLLARLFPGVRNGAQRRTTRGEDAGTAGTGTDTAMEILRRRYARGELTKEEYETMRHDLAS